MTTALVTSPPRTRLPLQEAPPAPPLTLLHAGYIEQPAPALRRAPLRLTDAGRRTGSSDLRRHGLVCEEVLRRAPANS
jgi:hypothetical protein